MATLKGTKSYHFRCVYLDISKMPYQCADLNEKLKTQLLNNLHLNIGPQGNQVYLYQGLKGTFAYK